MKNNKYSIAVKALCILLAVFTLSACNGKIEKHTKSYKLPADFNSVESSTVAENNKYVMLWNDEIKAITITEKSSGRQWSTIPCDLTSEALTGFAKVNLQSPITVSYVEAEKKQLKTVNGFQGAVSKDTVSYDKIENGIKITYYFENISVSVAVEYILEEDGFTARIPIKEITEKEHMVYSISVLPFFTSVENSSSSYLFVPSGSGGIIYTDPNIKQYSEYSEAVYGEDASKSAPSKSETSYGAKLPIFGAADTNKGIASLGIITSGAESSKIEAQAADKEMLYSSVYATFALRGDDYVTISDVNGKMNNVIKYTSDIVDTEYFSVKYILISEKEKANYNGFAEIYRNYLKNSGQLKEVKQGSNYWLNILGGIRVPEMFLGIPYYSTKAATDFKTAEEIIKEAQQLTGDIPLVQLKGFGDYGLDIGKIAGGFGFSSAFGNKKDFKSLIDTSEKMKLDIYVDFDVIRFSCSSFAANTKSSAAKTANFTSASSNYINPATNVNHKSYKDYGFIKREMLSSIIDELCEKTEKLNIKGIGLGTLSSVAYSDYDQSKYYAKSYMAEDVIKELNKITKKNVKIASSMANLYAAGLSNCILGTPSESSDYSAIDVDIPFYQMVFKGNIPIYSSEINLSSNIRKAFLNALKCGEGLGFSVNGNYDFTFSTSFNSALAGGVWDDVKSEISTMISEADEYLNSVVDSEIISYSILNDNLSRTDFSNGTSIFVNIGESKEDTPLGTVEAMGFLYGEVKE